MTGNLNYGDISILALPILFHSEIHNRTNRTICAHSTSQPKESKQIILVVVVNNAIMQIAY